jgi:RimJ/RimL family protein N-acetyltransferase
MEIKSSQWGSSMQNTNIANSLNFTIRQAAPADAPRLIAFLDALAAETDIDIPLEPGEFVLTIPEEEAIMQEYADSDNSIFLVAETGDEIIATSNCRGGKRKALRHVAHFGISVARAWRGKGVGNAMMQEVVRWARENPIIHRVELEVYARNLPAIHLYEKYGFQVEGRRSHAIFQDGQFLDDLVMALLV